MNYFQAKGDLEFINQFHNDVVTLWEKEGTAERSIQTQNMWMSGNSPSEWQSLIQQTATEQDSNYQQLRRVVARKVGRAQHLATLHGIPAEFVSYPAPAVGGPIIRLPIFEAILRDTSHGGVDRQMIYDSLNRVMGACDDAQERAWRELINPFHLIKNLLFLILRTPFMLIDATGFNVSKFEDHFFGKLSKLVFLLGLAWGLFALGFGKADLIEVLKTYASSAGK